MNPIEAFKQVQAAFHNDDARQVREFLTAHPELKPHLDAPVGPFDSPAICCVRSRAMLDTLLDFGANIDAKSKWWAGGFGLLHSADPELAAYAISRGATVDAHAAARLGLFGKLRELVDADPAVVHARGGDGQTPLHFAATAEIADFLLDRGADVDAKDVDHESTAAQYMVRDRQDVAARLVARGCKTDILMAAALGDVGLVRRHLDADPEAVRVGVGDAHFPMADKRAGGTIYQWTLDGCPSPHQAARKFGRDDALALLLERSPPAVRLLDACWAEDEAAIAAVLAERPAAATELTAADKRQVALAAREGKATAVRLMLENGWPADATGQHGATPLHWAAFHGDRAMAEAILARSPPLEAKDADFAGTPLGWTMYGSREGWRRETGDYAAVAEALLAAGAAFPAEIGGSDAVQEVLRRHAPSTA